MTSHTVTGQPRPRYEQSPKIVSDDQSSVGIISIAEKKKKTVQISHTGPSVHDPALVVVRPRHSVPAALNNSNVASALSQFG